MLVYKFNFKLLLAARSNDEDLFGVFDGHGGPRAAIRASNEIGDQLEERLDELSENGELDEQAIRQALIDAFRMVNQYMFC